MAQSRKLKFKRNLWEHRLTADGYRLATVDEVRSNTESIIDEGLLPVKQDLNSSHSVGRALRLLDGHATYGPDQKSLDVKQDFHSYCKWKIVVKEKELDESDHKGKTKGSAFYSKDGSVLRKDVYSEILLSQSARDVALRLAAFHLDAEVLFWLLSTTSREELQRFKEVFQSNYPYKGSNSLEGARTLLTSNFGFQLPLQVDPSGNTVVDYLLELAKDSRQSEGDTWYVMGIVELLVNIFSPDIVRYENSNGKSFIDLAEEKGLIHVFTKLLAVSQSIQHPKIEPHFKKVLAEAIYRGYRPLLEMLLQLEDNLARIPSGGLLRCLRDAARKDHLKCVQKLFFMIKTPIHLARDGHESSFDKAGVIRKQDKDGKNLFHYAAEAPEGQVMDFLLQSSKSEVDLAFSTDYKGTTPLHIAASKNNAMAVRRLHDVLGDDKFRKCLQQTDSWGCTALQRAAKGGCKKVVELLLSGGSNPLKERDLRGKTALHYAAAGKEAKTARSICRMLLESFHTDGEKALLLWVNAAGIGTADDMREVDPYVKTYLREQKETLREVNLLREAVVFQEDGMARELLIRGAEIADIRGCTWKSNLPDYEKTVLDKVMKDFKKMKDQMKEQGRDRPSMEDRLGRNLLAGGLAALFLNRFIESPITVGIFGEWGMGKSSLMVQTENILLLTSAQLTFPNLLPFEKFDRARKIILSRSGMKMYELIKGGAASFLSNTESKNKNPLIHILEDYKREYHSVYKSLACMDTELTLQSNIQHSLHEGQEYAFKEVPRILTIQYNAWHYTDEHQAWAGLAVSITKEIEKAMTKDQWLSTCWRYSWNKNKANIWLYVFLPCLLAIFLSGWVAWGAWMLLSQAKFEGLKFGSIPITITIIVWVVIRSIISVVKPVSTQMKGYMTSPNHTSHLGYQEEVISDINFLKKELGKKPYRFFSFLSWKLRWNEFGLCGTGDYVENTGIVKFTPASEDQLRIITFVDDLDRCEEKVVLQVLSAINLVLAECKINVILGMDKKMIQRAITRNFEYLDDSDLAEKFICKIIQIPLSLPDSTKKEMQTFLKYQMGWKSSSQQKSRVQWKSSLDIDEDLNYSTSVICDEEEQDNSSQDNTVLEIVSDEEEQEISNQDNTVLEIGCCTKVGTRCNGITRKILDYLLSKCFSICKFFSKEYEDLNSQEEKLASSEGIQLTREMGLSLLTQDEADIFLNLSVFVTGAQRLPREWKRLLNYHRLAWNCLSKRGEVYNLQTWKEELVAWIFVCWQWKYEMNTLIKGWHECAKVGRNHEDNEDESCVTRHGPSLGLIVKQYVTKLGKLQGLEESGGNTTAKRKENMLMAKGTLRENKLLLYALEDEDEKAPTQERWRNLQKALRIQDVTMKGIQFFQQFRLHCETDYLPWPLHESESNQAEPANETDHL